MKRKVYVLFLLFLAVAATNSIYAQTRISALKLPKKMINFERYEKVFQLLKDGEKTNEPWVVYSDRGDDFGSQYFVTEEEPTRVHIYKATGCERGSTRLINPEDKGWREKESLLIYFGAEFTTGSLIHKKCVILNSRDVIEKITSGEMSESDVPLFNSPDSKKSVKNVPLYYIYFIYKTDKDNKRILIGKNYYCKTTSFNEEILGWVDKDRVHEYNTRICFEPNYEESAVQFRRCNPVYAAKVFSFRSDATAFLNGDTSVQPFWPEPNYYFFRNPEFKGDPSDNTSINFDGDKQKLPDTLLSRLCSYDVKKAKQSKILTGKPLPGYKFRFPLIEIDRNEIDRKTDEVFKMGVAGRMVINAVNNDALCEELSRNKRKINIYFILDNSIDKNKLLFPLGQIEQGYKEFDKSYGVCFYPSTPMKYRIDLGEWDKQSNTPNYEFARDFIIKYKPENPNPGDNYLRSLKRILANQKFESNKTNILIIINNQKVSNSEFTELKAEIQVKLVEKNCFVIAYDYSRDENFKNQIQEIMVNANNLFAKKQGLVSEISSFEEDNGIEIMYSYLLAIIARKKENVSGVALMDKLLASASNKIIGTVDNFISLQCSGKEQSQTGVNVHQEDPFVKGQLAITVKNSKVQSIRFLEKGYGIMRYRNMSATGKEPVWKADVLFHRGELQTIATMLDELDINQNNSDFSKKLYELYVKLFNRFVGEDIPIEQLRELTPAQIMNKIIGDSFDYNTTDQIKLLPLGRIESNDQQMQGMYTSFKLSLQEHKKRIAQIIASNDLMFCLDCNSEKKTSDNIYYYWVPIDVLP